MTREEKCLLAIERGITYNPETGDVFGIYGKEITGKHNSGYIFISLYHENKQYLLLGHQFAWYWVNKKCVNCLDHINGIKDDNRIENLRSITHQHNQWNRKTAKGYTWNKLANKWQVRIQLNGKKINLGYFENEQEAHNKYLEAKEKYHKIN